MFGPHSCLDPTRDRTHRDATVRAMLRMLQAQGVKLRAQDETCVALWEAMRVQEEVIEGLQAEVASLRGSSHVRDAVQEETDRSGTDRPGTDVENIELRVDKDGEVTVMGRGCQATGRTAHPHQPTTRLAASQPCYQPLC